MQEYAAGATLNGLARERNLIRVWISKSGSGEFDPEVGAATLLGDYEAKIVALERMVGRQALEIEFLKGGSAARTVSRSEPQGWLPGCGARPSESWCDPGGRARRERTAIDGDLRLVDG